MKDQPSNDSKAFSVQVDSEILRRIRQHARSSMSAEICGILIGSQKDDTVVVEACIPGEKAAQGGAHVTFTQDTWAHIYKVKDKDYPDKSVVGWYHSHPGFGVFLSDHDLFIHENFFSARHQVAWVFDPHSDEEGCFGWRDGRTKRLTEIKVMTRCKPEIDTARQEPTALPSSPRPEPAKKTMTSRAKGKLPGFVKAIVVLLLLAGAAFFLKRFLPERMLGFFDWKDRPATWIVLSLCLVVLLRFAMRLRVNRKRSQERAKADQSSLTTCKPEGKTAPASAEKRKP